MNKIFILSFALLGLLCLAAAKDSVVAVSGDSTHFRAYEADWYPSIDPRILELKGISVTEKDDHDVTVDAVDFIITNFNQTTLAFTYFHEEALVKGNLSNPGNLSALAAAAFAFYIRTYAVFEFTDNNGIAGFQNDTSDEITGYYDLSKEDLLWKPMVIDSFNVTDAKGETFKVWEIAMQTLDEVFLMRFLVCGTEVEVNGVKIDSDTMKIDFEIRWFNNSRFQPAPWTTGPSNLPNAQVGFGLLAAVFVEEVEFIADKGNQTTNPSLSVSAGQYVGFFQWEPTADVTVNGEVAAGAVSFDVSANASEAQGGEFVEVRIIFFSFAAHRPSLVYWDPELGAQIPYNNTGSTTAQGSSTTGSKSTGLSGGATTAQGANSAFTLVPAIFLISLILSMLF